MLIGFKEFLDISDFSHRFNSVNSLVHNALSSDIPADLGDLLNQDGDLLASTSSDVETSRELLSDEIGQEDGDQKRHKEVKGLSCLHHDDD